MFLRSGQCSRRKWRCAAIFVQTVQLDIVCLDLVLWDIDPPGFVCPSEMMKVMMLLCIHFCSSFPPLCCLWWKRSYCFGSEVNFLHVQIFISVHLFVTSNRISKASLDCWTFILVKFCRWNKVNSLIFHTGAHLSLWSELSVCPITAVCLCYQGGSSSACWDPEQPSIHSVLIGTLLTEFCLVLLLLSTRSTENTQSTPSHQSDWLLQLFNLCMNSLTSIIHF